MPEITPTYRIWMLRLILPFKFGKPITGLLIFLVLWAVLGFVSENVNSTIEVSIYLKLFLIATCSYIVPVFAHIIDRTLVAFDEVAPMLDATSEEISMWRRQFTHQSARWTFVVTASALVLWLCHICLLEWSYGRNILDIFASNQYATSLGAALVWVTLMTANSSLILNARLLATLGQRLKLDLLRGSSHVTLAKVAVMSTLSIIGAQALFVLLVIDSDSNWVAFTPGFAITTVPMLALFFIPVWPMHQRLRSTKREELDAIDRQLAALRPEPNIDFSATDKLDQLNPLLLYRREIRQVSEWPFDVSALARLVLYLILPPLTWVGAALIENMVDAMV
jgi:hypothetical protein